jgi:hypothetical protein
VTHLILFATMIHVKTDRLLAVHLDMTSVM